MMEEEWASEHYLVAVGFHPTFGIHRPTDKWGTKPEYTNLRIFLLKDGYLRIAPEVFMRVVANRKAAEKHYRRIEPLAPKTGVVRMIRLTEKQFMNMYYVTGEDDYQEKTVGANCHIVI